MAYPTGQCTWYVDGQLPFIHALGNLGDAHSWGAAAAARGLLVDDVPAVGCCVCFQPGADGAGGYGHVAVVTEVSGSSFWVSEQDFPRAGVTTTRHIGSIAWGVAFIHPPAEPPPPPPLPAGDGMSTDKQITHSNGTVHWAYIHPDRTIWHGAFPPGGAQPEMVPVGQPTGYATAIHAMFQRTQADGVPRADDPVVLVVLGLDGAEWYEHGSSASADLTADGSAEWTRRG